MIMEIASITIRPGTNAEFERDVRKAVPLFERAEGCIGMRLEQVIEDRSHYRLIVGWESVEHHTGMFRPSTDFQLWRELISPWIAAPPSVEHSELVIGGFVRPSAEQQPMLGA